MKKCPIKIKKEDRIPLCLNVALHVAAISLMATALHKLCRIHKGIKEIRKGAKEIEKGRKELRK